MQQHERSSAVDVHTVDNDSIINAPDEHSRSWKNMCTCMYAETICDWGTLEADNVGNLHLLLVGLRVLDATSTAA